MRSPQRTWQTCLLVLGLSALASGADPAAATKAPPLALSDEDFTQLTERTEAVVREVLAKSRPDKASVARARTAAVVLAAAGQNAPAPAALRPRQLTRETALALVAALDKSDFAAGLRLAGGLAAKPAADAKPAPGAGVVLGKTVDFLDLMGLFNEPGGKKAGDLPAAMLTPELRYFGWQAAAAGELSAGHTSPKIAKDPPGWQKYSDELKQSGLALADAVKSKDGKAAREAANRMQNSCTDCHQKFK
jgi:hypothetical protein